MLRDVLRGVASTGGVECCDGGVMVDFGLTRESLDSITDLDIAFGTTKLLPAYCHVPEEFKHGNRYTQLMDLMFGEQPLPDWEIVFRKGFDDPDAPDALNRAVTAHLRSFEPKHQHKIAGLGYLVSLVFELHPSPG